MQYEWIIYYDNDTTFSNLNGTPWDAPRTGVEIIVQANEVIGYELIHTDGDYFIYDKNRGGWRITDNFGIHDHLITVKSPLILFGRQMADGKFNQLREKVKTECGAKSGWMRREKGPR